jgi:hypothetical protein
MFGASTAPFGPRTLARATEVRDLVTRVFDEVKKHDNVSGTDRDNRLGEVSIADTAAISVPGIRIPAWQVVEDLQTAVVSFDAASGKVKSGRVENDFHPVEPRYRHAGGSDVMTMSQTTFKGRPATLLTYDRDEWRTTFGEYHYEKVVVDAQSGDVMAYKGRDKHMPLSSALKEMVTTPAGLMLTVMAGALFGFPGTLTGTLIGPVAGIVAAGATVVGFALAKTRPWSRELPTRNE